MSSEKRCEERREEHIDRTNESGTHDSETMRRKSGDIASDHQTIKDSRLSKHTDQKLWRHERSH